MAANDPRACSKENALTLTAVTAKRYKTSAVASLASPSPSRIMSRRLGTRSLRAIAIGATASGGDTIAPKTNPTGQGRPNRRWVAVAVAAVVNRTEPTASNEMGRRLKRNSRQLIATAEE